MGNVSERLRVILFFDMTLENFMVQKVTNVYYLKDFAVEKLRKKESLKQCKFFLNYLEKC